MRRLSSILTKSQPKLVINSHYLVENLVKIIQSLPRDWQLKPDFKFTTFEELFVMFLKEMKVSNRKIFLSHFKIQAGTFAQLLKSEFELNVEQVEVFLDSDDLTSLNDLSFQVLSSTDFYLLMSLW